MQCKFQFLLLLIPFRKLKHLWLNSKNRCALWFSVNCSFSYFHILFHLFLLFSFPFSLSIALLSSSLLPSSFHLFSPPPSPLPLYPPSLLPSLLPFVLPSLLSFPSPPSFSTSLPAPLSLSLSLSLSLPSLSSLLNVVFMIRSFL